MHPNNQKPRLAAVEPPSTPSEPSTSAPPSSADVLASIPLDLIDTADQNIRRDDYEDGIAELAADIAANGLLQPIVVSQNGNQRFQLRAGSRRTRAFKYLNRTHIPAIITDPGNRPLIGDALRENLLRKQLSLSEECDAVTRMQNEGFSTDQISRATGHGRKWVLTRLLVPNLPADLQEALLTQRISVGAAEALALLEDESGRRLLTTETINAALSVPQVREAVRVWKAHAEALNRDAAALPAGPQTVMAPVIAARCQLCGDTHDQATMPLIRVCPGGCKPRTTQPTPEDSNHGGT